ncbi:MAG: OmpA family protein [Acidobacteriota bacterium]
MKRALGALLLACLCGGADALAQTRKGSWEITPFAGVFNGSTRLADGIDTMPGIRIGYALNRWWQVDVAYSQLSSTDVFQPVGSRRIQTQSDLGQRVVRNTRFDGPAESDVDFLDFNILLATHPHYRRWMFYGTIGWGMRNVDGAMTQSQVDRNFPNGPERRALDLNGDGDTLDMVVLDGQVEDESMVPTALCLACAGTVLLDPNDPTSERYVAGPSLESFDSSQWNVGGGAWLRLTDVMSLRFDVRIESGIADSFDAQTLTTGLAFRLGGEGPIDDDEDGVPSFRDTCPETPVGAIVDEAGCPSDTDGDQVLDGLDQCPGTPEGWPVEPDGCPTDSDADGVPDGRDTCAETLEGAVVDFEGCAVDSDGDGIPDGLDQCALTPEGAAVDADGCPIDTDGDGVFDGLDQCDGTASDLTVDSVGCPIDSDGDGLRDDVDACRDFAGPGGIDETGCPSMRLDRETRIPLPAVMFAFGSSVLTDEAQADLVPLLAAMAYYGDVTIEIEGHTDDIGSERENFLVSLERARTVRQWLVDGGIDPARVAIRGYGETRPIADNLTEEGRRQNRRIEVLVTGTVEAGGAE